MADNLLSLHSSIVALLGAVLGGVGVKVVDQWFSLRKSHSRGQTDIQLELHRELAKVREETRVDLEKVEMELDEWKQKYYKLMEDHQTLVAENLYMQVRNKDLEARVKVLETRLLELERKGGRGRD